MSMTERRPGIGDNTDAPDWAKLESDRLGREYSELALVTVPGLIAEASVIPDEIEDDERKSEVTSLIKRIRDAKVRIEGFHDVEKQPHLRRGQGADQFFFGLWDSLVKRNKRDREGIGDVLQRKLTAYDAAVLARKQEELRQAAAKAAAEAAAKAAAEAAAKRAAEEAEAAAARARNPVRIEEKQVAAAVALTTAAIATAESRVATDQAEAAHIDTLAKPADLMRQRGVDGTLSTMGTEAFAVVEDAALLDLEKLRPFIKIAALEAALKGFASATDYRQPMPGARIGRRPKSIVR